MARLQMTRDGNLPENVVMRGWWYRWRHSDFTPLRTILHTQTALGALAVGLALLRHAVLRSTTLPNRSQVRRLTLFEASGSPGPPHCQQWHRDPVCRLCLANSRASSSRFSSIWCGVHGFAWSAVVTRSTSSTRRREWRRLPDSRITIEPWRERSTSLQRRLREYLTQAITL